MVSRFTALTLWVFVFAVIHTRGKNQDLDAYLVMTAADLPFEAVAVGVQKAAVAAAAAAVAATAAPPPAAAARPPTAAAPLPAAAAPPRAVAAPAPQVPQLCTASPSSFPAQVVLLPNSTPVPAPIVKGQSARRWQVRPRIELFQIEPQTKASNLGESSCDQKRNLVSLMRNRDVLYTAKVRRRYEITLHCCFWLNTMRVQVGVCITSKQYSTSHQCWSIMTLHPPNLSSFTCSTTICSYQFQLKN